MLKKIFLIITFLIPSIIFAEKPKYDIKVKFTGLKDTICYLAHYYGDKQYVHDTAKIDSKGTCEFKGNKTLDGGIYIVFFSTKRHFDIIIDKQQTFSLEADTANFVGTMKVKG